MAKSPSAEQLQALGEAVKKRREELRLTLKEAAKKSKVAEATWNEVSMGRRMPYGKTIAAIEDALEWEYGSCQAILDGDTATPRKPSLDPAAPEREMVITDLSDPDQKLTIIVSGRRPLSEADSQRIIRMAKEALRQHKDVHHRANNVGTAE